MGAWGTNIFEDDAALDMLDEINDMDDIDEFVEEVFQNALDLNYLEYDDGISVLVCAALIDWKINHTKYEILAEDYEELLEMIDDSVIELYQDDAVDALKLVISNASELNELWKENTEDYPKWKMNIVKLINRLS